MFVVKSVENKGHSAYPKETFMKVLHNILDLTVGQNGAHKILAGGNANIQWGDKVCSVNMEDLRVQLNDWKQVVRKPNEKFLYTIEVIDDALIDNAMYALKSRGSIVVEEFNGREYITSGQFYNAEQDIVSAVLCRYPLLPAVLLATA